MSIGALWMSKMVNHGENNSPNALSRKHLFIIRPHPQDLDDLLLFQHLIDESMLDIDPPRESARQIADQFFVGRWILEGMCRKNSKKLFGRWLKPGLLDFASILYRLSGEYDLIAHQFSLVAHLSTGVFMPLMIDSLMPGMPTR